MYNDSTQDKSGYPAIFPKIAEEWKKLESTRSPIVVQDLKFKMPIGQGKPCLLLENVLSKEECKLLIQSSEKSGFEKAEDYCYMYRDRYNDRIMSDDAEFCKVIWDRVAPFIPQEHDGWVVKGLNNRWRYCRYFKDHYFGAHTDGRFAPSRMERSFLTFMLYLNGTNDKDLGGFKGGSTRFLSRNGNVKLELPPLTGSALVFLQEDMDLYHDGEKIYEGTKYILRTDVMYKVSLA